MFAKTLILTGLLFAANAANAQVPTSLTISKSGVGASVVNNLGMTATTRPGGTTTQRISMRFKGDDYFYDPARLWEPNGYQLWVVLRGSGVADGRGVLIGNIHQLAASDPSSGACPHTGTMEAMLFASSQRLFGASCLNAGNRFIDDIWYKVIVDVNDSKYVKYTLYESDIYGNHNRTIASNVQTLVVPLSGNPDPAINGTGVGIASTNSSGDGAFSLSIQDIAVTWF